ncbi:MAG: Ig-like domain-containing protein [Proteobacteria bacterium]|nr:Ig-like domain-containing protein [Pseudomonadota bacterium]
MIRRFNPRYALLPVTLFLGACTTDSDESVTPVTVPDGGNTGFVATYQPDVALMPFPTDAWRSGSTDGTLNIIEFDTNPLLSHVEQLNLLDGFGLNSPIWADFSDPVDEETLVLGQTVFVFRVAVAGNAVPPTPVGSFDIGTAGFQGGRSVLELNPTAPLDPLTTYAVLVTAGVQSSDGINASADAAFQAMVDAFPADDTASDSATVEAIYDGMVSSLLGLAEGAGIGADNVVAAWTFTTQSISDSLALVEAMAAPQTNAIIPMGMTTADLNPALAGKADVYAGVIEMPYYLDPANPLTSFWEPVDASCATAIGAGLIEEASESTTVYCPLPEEQATVRVPVLITIPNGASATSTSAAQSAHSPVPTGATVCG